MKCVQCGKELPKWVNDFVAARANKPETNTTGPDGIRITSGVRLGPTGYCSEKCREQYRKANNARSKKGGEPDTPRL